LRAGHKETAPIRHPGSRWLNLVWNRATSASVRPGQRPRRPPLQ
jgi:hypothetical protein